eukprot:m.569691 g.569691  ORF g.569691 m.569691 type:complete len:558 (+) comp57842_c0_seq5:598-2271(+)
MAGCVVCSTDTGAPTIACASCLGLFHARCVELPEALFVVALTYEWECSACKACAVCTTLENEDSMLLCDRCDRGVHMYCNKPVLQGVPTGDFVCGFCEGTLKATRRASTSSSRRTSASQTDSRHRRRPDARTTPKLSEPVRRKAALSLRTERSAKHSARSSRSSGFGEDEQSSNEDPSFDLDSEGHADSDPTPARNSAAQDRKKSSRSSREASTTRSRAPKPPLRPSLQLSTAHVEDDAEQAPVPTIDCTSTDHKWFDSAQTAAQAATPKSALRSLPDSRKQRLIEIGNHELEAWYIAPYPEEYARLPKMYLCEFCLSYMKSKQTLARHAAKCYAQGRPPGTEIYRCGALQIWEVDGNVSTLYCQNLCLLAKLFLDHKTLYYDVEPFLFYVLTESDEHGSHFVGYFSKEKSSIMNYNVSCILTLPCIQRKGYGRLLIDFSYLLSRREEKLGSPEKPLSYLGKLTYQRYWRDVVFLFLHTVADKTSVTIDAICTATGMTAEDVLGTLAENEMLTIGADDEATLALDEHRISAHCDALALQPQKKLAPEKLRWVPFVVK